MFPFYSILSIETREREGEREREREGERERERVGGEKWGKRRK